MGQKNDLVLHLKEVYEDIYFLVIISKNFNLIDICQDLISCDKIISMLTRHNISILCCFSGKLS